MPSFHTEVNTSEAQGRLLTLIRTVPNELARAVGDTADDAVLIFSAFAPKGRTGRLGRGIRAIGAQGRLSSGRFATGRQFAIVASARNADGFDYVGVSRFGHRKEFIVPRHDRAVASVISTRKPRRDGQTTPGRPALRISARNGGAAIYRNQVRGVKRTHDWAESAQGAVNRELESRSAQLAHRIEARFR